MITKIGENAEFQGQARDHLGNVLLLDCLRYLTLDTLVLQNFGQTFRSDSVERTLDIECDNS